MRWNFKPRSKDIVKGQCFCTGNGVNKDKRQCHLCRNKDVREGFKEVAGHVYCPACLGNADGKEISHG